MGSAIAVLDRCPEVRRMLGEIGHEGVDWITPAHLSAPLKAGKFSIVVVLAPGS